VPKEMQLLPQRIVHNHLVGIISFMETSA